MTLGEIELAGRRQALSVARQELLAAEADHARACAETAASTHSGFLEGDWDDHAAAAQKLRRRRDRLRRVIEALERAGGTG
jgi:hypothetical protein